MENLVYFSFYEKDLKTVLALKRKVRDPNYENLNFKVKRLLRRWDTDDISAMQKAIARAMKGATRTIVLVGNGTYKSKWLPEEVKMSRDAGNPVYAVRLEGTYGAKPTCLSNANIHLYDWGEEALQNLATW